MAVRWMTKRERERALIFSDRYGQPVADVFCTFGGTYVAFDDGTSLALPRDNDNT